MDTLFPFPRERAVVAPGAVHVPGWLPAARQRELVAACREWGRGPVPYRHIVLPGGGVMSVQSLGLGRRWVPYRYVDDVAVELPGWLADLGRAAVAEAYGDDVGYAPDTAFVNYYDAGAGAKMGMHQDKDEQSGAPVVSLSLGDRCVFRFGNTETRGKPYTDVELGSGDLFVFGGESRFAFHGVPKVVPGTAPPALGLSGRLNITLRETGL